MGNLNSGIPYPWEKLVRPLQLSRITYTLGTVLLAHFVVFRKFYYAKPRWKLFMSLIALLIVFILFRYLLEEIIYPALLGYGNYNPVTTFRFYVIDNVYFGSIIIFIGFVLFLFDELFRNQQRQAALQEQKKQAELNFLQAQMNPHFLFNSLNNIYSLARDQHPQTADSLLKLSDMMRYITYQKEKEVTLEKELEYVHNMIGIQQLRHPYPLAVQFDIVASILSCKILPLLLIPLVENSLKHGDLSDPAVPLLIAVRSQQNKLVFTISNRIAAKADPHSGGVGIKNLQRRLELLYHPGEYLFSTTKKDGLFLVNLSIPLSR